MCATPPTVFMTPTSKKLKGHIGLALSLGPVRRVRVKLSTRSGTVRARILKFGMLFVYEN